MKKIVEGITIHKHYSIIHQQIFNVTKAKLQAKNSCPGELPMFLFMNLNDSQSLSKWTLQTYLSWIPKKPNLPLRMELSKYSEQGMNCQLLQRHISCVLADQPLKTIPPVFFLLFLLAKLIEMSKLFTIKINQPSISLSSPPPPPYILIVIHLLTSTNNVIHVVDH